MGTVLMFELLVSFLIIANTTSFPEDKFLLLVDGPCFYICTCYLLNQRWAQQSLITILVCYNLPNIFCLKIRKCFMAYQQNLYSLGQLPQQRWERQIFQARAHVLCCFQSCCKNFSHRTSVKRHKRTLYWYSTQIEMGTLQYLNLL